VADKHPELATRPVYLETMDASPFGEAFKEMLQYNMFKLGLALTEDPDNSIHLKYKGKILHHKADRVAGDYVAAENMAPGAVLLGAGAGFGIAAVARAIDFTSFAAGQSALATAGVTLGAAGLLELAVASQYTSITNTEYIFSAEISWAAKTYDMYLDVYYINSEDAYQYMTLVNKTPHKSDTVMSGRAIKVVDDRPVSGPRKK
jgi:hypothetical protein